MISRSKSLNAGKGKPGTPNSGGGGGSAGFGRGGSAARGGGGGGGGFGRGGSAPRDAEKKKRALLQRSKSVNIGKRTQVTKLLKIKRKFIYLNVQIFLKQIH